MVRSVVGSVLAVIGAAAAVWSPFRAWYDGRRGRDYRLGDLFSGGGVTGARAELFGSMFLPFVILALLALVGLVLRSRALVALAGIVVLGFTVLWMVRVAQAEDELVLTANGHGLGVGVAGALGGGLLLLVGALLMSGRGHHGRHRPEPATGSTEAYDQPYPETQTQARTWDQPQAQSRPQPWDQDQNQTWANDETWANGHPDTDRTGGPGPGPGGSSRQDGPA
ncbi:hypothetical protein ACIREE_06720 [Streptomyces sp. NPDC102467]|uniref:hypothetical protein n=1 Tax=Streptomyces sp. NPDC102467 TaxID=3366179 RepID=UPI003826FB0A